jgi:thiamine pyrophosphate-dependent acetolactate synthase large subunit-like protein
VDNIGTASEDGPVTGARELLRVLAGHGVDTVFGLPGVHNLAVWEAARERGPRLVGVRHEQTAGYAADGYARASGRLGVAVVTTGPGAANTLGAVGEAMASGSPVLVVATDIPSTLRRPGVYRGVLHETRDQRAMFLPVVKDGWNVASADDLAASTDRAARLALSAPQGPVYLGVPTDFLTATVEPGAAAPTMHSPAEECPGADLDRAAAALAAARRPLVWAGGGALRSGAGAEVTALAERIGAAVVTTYGGRGVIPADHPYAVHGPVHIPEVGRLWDEADVVVAVGTDLDGMMTQNWAMPAPPTLVAVNVDPADAAKNYPPDLVLAGDAARVLAPLVDALPEREIDQDLAARLAALNAAVRKGVLAEEPQAAHLLDTLDAVLPPDAVLVADMCIPGYWLGGFHRVRRPRGFAYPVGWGTLGFGFPAALGAALGGAARAVSVCGDGGFLFACGELATAAQERLPVTVVLVDDGGYGMLRFDQANAGHPSFGVDLHTPDWVALARAFGLDAAAVHGFGAEFADRLAEFVAADGPNVLVVSAALTPPPNTSPRWYRRR